MLLLFAVLLLLLFGGAGLFVHALWWGLIIAVVIGIVHVLEGRGPRI